jgi:hypothetical protein
MSTISEEPFVFDLSKPISTFVNKPQTRLNYLVRNGPSKTIKLNTFGFILQKQSNAGKELGIAFDSHTIEQDLLISHSILAFPNDRISNILLSYYYKDKSKFSYMIDVMKNPFLNDNIKKEFMEAFCKAQRLYYTLSKFTKIFKYRTSPLRNSEDMFMNPINKGDKNVISILQHDQLYLFTVSDLKRIIDTALSNSPWFFNEPLPVKNPYNNLPFQKSDLYNIYFFMKSRIIHMSPLFQQYFMSNFHLAHFKDTNPVLIQTAYIKQYVKNMDVKVAYENILKIFRTINYNKNKIEIDPDFPKERLVTIMRPYLTMFYLSSFSFDVITKQNSRIRLRNALSAFYRYNPQFGRKFIHVSKKRTLSFNDKHKPFRLESSLADFSKSHMNVDDLADDASIDSGDSDSVASVQNRQHQHYVDHPMQVQIVGVEVSMSNEDDDDSISDLEEENEEMYDP